MRRPLPEDGLASLKQYKYQSTGYSQLEHALNPYWEYCVSLLPITMAPNMVTLIGTAVLFLAFVVVLFCAPTLTEELPGMVCVAAGLALFAYNTLDAIDGKQARRTKSSSPLGQLFDHGCDALAVLLILVPFSALLGFGTGWKCLTLHCTVLVPFFLAQWEEFHLHVMRTMVGGVGIAEGHAIIIFTWIASAVLPFGWATTPVVTVAGVPVTYANCILVANVCMSLFFACSFIGNVVWLHSKPRALVHLLPISLVALLAAYLMASDSRVTTQYPMVYLLATVLSIVYLATQVVVYGMCRVSFPLLQYSSALHMLLVVNEFVRWVDDGLLVSVVLACVLASYCYWVQGVIYQITRELGIFCLSLKRRTL